jgi:hypothetical protein
MVSEHREFGVPCGVGCVGPEEDHGGPELGDGVEEGSGWQRSSEHHAGLVHFGESGGKGVQGQDVLVPVGCREQDRRAAVPATSPSDQRGQSGPGALGQQVLGRDAVRGLIEAFTASAQRWSQEVSPCVDDPWARNVSFMIVMAVVWSSSRAAVVRASTFSASAGGGDAGSRGGTRAPRLSVRSLPRVRSSGNSGSPLPS